ncbi:MAG: DUF6273 domain-containing protein [Lachnospiraceae bacterium]|nr:DUF6273 domain-containing protein [Lachnospiraceae bacterium]
MLKKLKTLFHNRYTALIPAAVTLALSIGVLQITVLAKPAIIRDPRIDEDGKATWDKVAFGSYQQTVTDPVPTPIKWRILSVNSDGTNAFLIADQVLDCMRFNSTKWEGSTLRSWLNNDFYNSAFSEEDQKAIIETEVENPVFEETGVAEQKPTMEKVYVLSYWEASNEEFGFLNNRTRRTMVTPYAKTRALQFSDIDTANWWLRTKGNKEPADMISTVNTGGGLQKDWYSTRTVGIGVRPVLHVDLTSSCVTDAGTVSSLGESMLPKGPGRDIKELSAPRSKDEVVTWDCVWFGHYVQDVTFEKTPIEWRVLSVNDDGTDAFLLAEWLLEPRPFHNTASTAITWKDSDLRRWLNEDFLKTAFSEEEKKLIRTTTVRTETRTEGEKPEETLDQIFLLSQAEAYAPLYGFAEVDNNSENTDRQSEVTPYAFANGARGNNINRGKWWLRSPSPTGSMRVISEDGHLNGSRVEGNSSCIRPTLHVDLNSMLVRPIGTETKSPKRHDTTADEEWMALDPEQWEKDLLQLEEARKVLGKIGEIADDEESKGRIKAARDSYENLPYSVKWKYYDENLQTLKEAEETYRQLVQNNIAAARQVTDLIDAIKDQTGDKRKAIADARSAYDALPAQAKKWVPADKLAELEVAEKKLSEPEKTEGEKQKDGDKEAGDSVRKPSKVKIRSAKIRQAKNKKPVLTVKWKKSKRANGYQVKYSTGRKFRKGKRTKTGTVRSAKKTTFSTKKISGAKTWYVKVRAYCKTNDGKKVYGSWSKVKKVRK